MKTDRELMQQIPRCAWTGGDAPRPLAEISRQELSLVRLAFREAMQESVNYWGDGKALCDTALGNARIQWNRARHDAHASIRNAHRLGLYKSQD